MKDERGEEVMSLLATEAVCRFYGTPPWLVDSAYDAPRTRLGRRLSSARWSLYRYRLLRKWLP